MSDDVELGSSGIRERARGALYGLAIGDALGMPTQSLPRALIVERHGELVTGFSAAAPDHPLAAGLPAASVTDDTAQALLLAQLLIDTDARFTPAQWARRLLDWEEVMRARGSLDLLGPSTRRALGELMAGGDPAETGRFGDTNGAAMRIAPVGIATRPGALLLDRVIEASAVTHNTGLALAGAAAVATAVSVGVDGAGPAAATAAAVDAARRAAGAGHWMAGADVAARITWALALVQGRTVAAAIAAIGELVGTSLHAQESVPAAFAAVQASGGDAWLAVRIAASVGGDCDTIAAMAGAIAGAVHGVDGFPEAAIAEVEEVNQLHLGPIADALLTLRRR